MSLPLREIVDEHFEFAGKIARAEVNRDGLRVGWAEFATVRWSTDGRRLIVLLAYGGTRPPPQPVFSYSRATGRASLVLVGAQTPLVGPGGWTVFARGNALWVGRISGR